MAREKKRSVLNSPSSKKQQSDRTRLYDVIIVGGGVSGCTIAKELSSSFKDILLIEAGKKFDRTSYPRSEIDSNSQLYWGGGIEFNKAANIGLLRPKVVGGGSIVNQALMDRFDDVALNSWQETSGIDFFNTSDLQAWYEKAESEINIQEIPEAARNRNAQLFQQGCEKNGYQWAPLKRAQKDCRYSDGNDCIECLSGCRIDSKQSMPVTVLPKAIENGLEVQSELEVQRIIHQKDQVQILTTNRFGETDFFKAKKVVLAAGAIGNSKLLIQSGFRETNSNIGRGFYTHPQFMSLGVYRDKVNAHKGAFQSLKSDDPNFRQQGFKLENVFAPPVALSMLLPGIGADHQALMKKITQMACIEVCLRDTTPGRIDVKKGKVLIDKNLGPEDREKKSKGQKVITNIFQSSGAQQVLHGKMGIGLHLMGGCAIGSDRKNSVVNSHFQIHDHENIYLADSSVFPNAPGINPSLTIMALSKKASHVIQEAL